MIDEHLGSETCEATSSNWACVSIYPTGLKERFQESHIVTLIGCEVLVNET
jgi:hypothetical protein